MIVIKDTQGRTVKLGKYAMTSAGRYLPRVTFQYVNFNAPIAGCVYAQYTNTADADFSPGFIVKLIQGELYIGYYKFNKKNTKIILRWAGIKL